MLRAGLLADICGGAKDFRTSPGPRDQSITYNIRIMLRNVGEAYKNYVAQTTGADDIIVSSRTYILTDVTRPESLSHADETNVRRASKNGEW